MAAADQKVAMEKLTLFFYFSFLDDEKAYGAALRGYRKIQKYFENNKEFTESDVNRFVIQTGEALMAKTSANSLIAKPSLVHGRILFPSGSDWGAWFSFRRNAEPEEFYAVLWARILNFPLEDVAHSLNISVGTLKYRIGHGLRNLGQLLSQGSSVVGK